MVRRLSSPVAGRLAGRAGLAALVLLATCLPGLASTPVTWLAPVGGETWTAGTQHTIAWSGGGATVFALAALPVPATTMYPILPQFPNTGYATWAIPPTLPPGTYTLSIGFVGDQTPYSSLEFTIVAPPECLFGCQQVSFSLPASNPNFAIPPTGFCGVTAHQAGAAAQAYVEAQLAGQCFEGYGIAPGSVVVDVTLLPVGACMAGTFGSYVAEASGFGCCCPEAVPSDATSWGGLKSRYR